jgi:hypothetical protein
MSSDDSEGDRTLLSSDRLAGTEWSDVPTDPDPRRHLDYELRDWELLTMSRDSDQVVFLPESEELLRDEAFVLAERADLCSLDENR